MSRTPKTPACCLHRASGRAVVRIDGRDYYLGAFDSEESRQRYDALIAEWLANGRTLAGVRPSGDGGADSAGPSVNELLLAYWRWAEAYYRYEGGRPSQEQLNVKEALKPLRRLYGMSPAREFGPMAMRAIQDDLARSGLARTVVNARVGRIRRFFKWAVSFGLLAPAVLQALQTVPGLQRGRCQAREADPIQPVPVEDVEATLPFLPYPVAGMVRVQLLTGCRAGEVMGMRAEDIDTSCPLWCWRPRRHKNTHRGGDRVIFLGPQAREAIRPFLRVRCPFCGGVGVPRQLDWQDDRCGPCRDRHEEGGTVPMPTPGAPAGDYHLFNPREYVADLHARRAGQRKTKRTPSELKRKRKANPKRQPAERYNRRSYRVAVLRACKRTGVAPWSPLQLRHTAATRIRALYGVEAARVILGHSRVETSQIYAERDLGRAAEVMKEIG
jgi:integrase